MRKHFIARGSYNLRGVKPQPESGGTTNVKGAIMKKAEIKQGGLYIAKVSGRITTVRVDTIRERSDWRGNTTTVYDVTNLKTGRKTTFKSAAKFRCVAQKEVQSRPFDETSTASSPARQIVTNANTEGKQCSDPTHFVEIEPTPLPPTESGVVERLPSEMALKPSACTEGNLVENSADNMDTNQPVPANNGDSRVTIPTTVLPATLPNSRNAQSVPECPPVAHIAVPAMIPTPFAQPPAPGFAANVANSRPAGRIAGSPVAGIVPNAEQEVILDTAANIGGGRVLVIAAGAGTGKTATLKMLEQILPGRGQYTAFNTSLVNESKTKFKRAACNTSHSLAFRAVGRQYQHRLGGERMQSHQVARILGIEPLTIQVPGQVDADGNPKPKLLQAGFLAGQVLAAIRRFCQSADHEISVQHLQHIDGIDIAGPDGQRGRENNDRVVEYLLPFAHKAWDDLSSVNGQLPFGHDIYVKIWQLGKGNDRPVIAADYILLDEAQDTAPVLLDILRQQTHALLILVGDDCQQIYEWRGACNAMKAFKGAPRRLLSQSYRFGQTIADVANAVLATLQEPTDLVMRGNPATSSRVAMATEPKCYLYRTNAGAIGRVMSAIEAGKRPHLIGGGKDIVDWCHAALDLQARRGTRHPELCCFDTWQEVITYSKTDEGSDLRLMVRMVEQFGAAHIRDALKNMPKEEDADLVACTAHKSKGREWGIVKLGQDFPTANKMTDADRRLLYVAATRAKLVLDITECPPFCGGHDKNGKDGESGNWIPGIQIAYTQPTPSEVVPDKSIKAETERITPAKAEANGNCQFTWYNFKNRWCIRGPAGMVVGEKVKVNRRNGSISTETIQSVCHKFSDAWVYTV